MKSRGLATEIFPLLLGFSLLLPQFGCGLSKPNTTTSGRLASQEGSSTSSCGNLTSDRGLAPGEKLASCDGSVTLSMQDDGNLVLYRGNTALAATDTVGKNTSEARMQGDGNFVLYDTGKKPLWASNTDGHAGAWLTVWNSGNVSISESSGNVVWTWLSTPLGSTSSTQAAPGPVSNGTSSDVVGKVTVGYQGWFGAPGDGNPRNSWIHWSRGTTPSPNNQTFELWPDVREYTTTFATNYANLGSGQSAKLFSSYSDSTIQLHVRWMRDYGIDTAALQRFGSGLGDSLVKAERDRTADLFRKASETFGRKFYIMYDISNWNDFAEKIKTDWTSTIVNSLKLTSSSAYAKHQGKPVVCIWGIGFSDRPGDAAQSLATINWFKNQGVYVIGGVPTNWRDSNGDSKGAFQEVYKAYNMVQPWFVGRINSLASSDDFVNNMVKKDVDYAKGLGVDYVPVVFPGFAWSNWNGGSRNSIPRLHGDFLWRQAFNLKNANALQGMYVAMFDEYDEGTAIAKAAEDQSMIPSNQYFLTLDADGVHVSSDFYLRLTGDIGKMMKGSIPVSASHPTSHDGGAAVVVGGGAGGGGGTTTVPVTPAPGGVATPASTPVASCTGSIASGFQFTQDQAVRSCNQKFNLVFQSDGNLVLYLASSGSALWSTGTEGKGATKAVFQTDGNLVVYAGNSALWSSQTAGKSGAKLMLQDDGNLVIYYSQAAVWSSGTAGN